MNDAAVVCVAQANRRLPNDVDGLGNCQRPRRLHDVGQIVAVDVLHHQVVAAVVNSRVVGRDDVLMIELSSGFNFTLEPSPQIIRLRQRLQQEFDRDRTFHPPVASFEHVAHSPAADRVGDNVIANNQRDIITANQHFALVRRQQFLLDKGGGSIFRRVSFQHLILLLNDRVIKQSRLFNSLEEVLRSNGHTLTPDAKFMSASSGKRMREINAFIPERESVIEVRQNGETIRTFPGHRVRISKHFVNSWCNLRRPFHERRHLRFRRRLAAVSVNAHDVEKLNRQLRLKHEPAATLHGHHARATAAPIDQANVLCSRVAH